MAPPEKPALQQKVDVRLKAALLARVQTAQLLRLSEPEMASLVREIEEDPLFMKLLYPSRPEWKVVRFQPHPRARLSGSFFEMSERTLPSSAPVDVVGLIDQNKDILDAIRRMGRDKFEQHFLRAEETLSPAAVAKACGMREEDVARVQRFLVSFSVQSEFFDPSSRSIGDGGGQRRICRLARLEVGADGEASFDITAPHLARGRYDIHYERFEALARSETLTPEERRHLRAFVRRLELVNWRQNTLFRILDRLCHGHAGYLRSRDSLKRAPITQRQMARFLSVAPSTVNRAIHDRSLVMPWGEEVLLSELFVNRKALCVEALGVFEAEDPDFNVKNDEELRRDLEKALGVLVPRRTLNTYRNILAKKSGETGGHP